MSDPDNDRNDNDAKAAAKAAANSAEKNGKDRTKAALVGASVGIGSAAIVAALLYAGRLKSQKRDGGGEKA